MKTTTVTPEEARAVWDSLYEPNPKRVSDKLAQVGRKVTAQTIARWKRMDWKLKPGKVRHTPASFAMQALDTAFPVVTKDATANIADIIPFATTKFMTSEEEVEMLAGLDELGRQIMNMGNGELLLQGNKAVLRTGIFIEAVLMRNKQLIIDNPAGVARLYQAMAYGAVAGTNGLKEAAAVAERFAPPKEVNGRPALANKSMTVYPPGSDDPLSHALENYAREVG